MRTLKISLIFLVAILSGYFSFPREPSLAKVSEPTAVKNHVSLESTNTLFVPTLVSSKTPKPFTFEKVSAHAMVDDFEYGDGVLVFHSTPDNSLCRTSKVSKVCRTFPNKIERIVFVTSTKVLLETNNEVQRLELWGWKDSEKPTLLYSIKAKEAEKFWGNATYFPKENVLVTSKKVGGQNEVSVYFLEKKTQRNLNFRDDEAIYLGHVSGTLYIQTFGVSWSYLVGIDITTLDVILEKRVDRARQYFISHGIVRYLDKGSGDIKNLQGRTEISSLGRIPEYTNKSCYGYTVDGASTLTLLLSGQQESTFGYRYDKKIVKYRITSNQIYILYSDNKLQIWRYA